MGGKARLALTAALLLHGAAFVVILASSQGGWELLTNADTLSTLLILRDALADPASLGDWYHPPSLYVFPDWLIALPAVLLLPAEWAPPAFAALLLFAQTFVGGWIVASARIMPLWFGISRFGALYLGTFLALPLLARIGAGDGGMTSAHLLTVFAGSLHGGSLLAGLVTLAVLVRYSLQGLRRWERAGLLATAFASGFSDFSYVAHFALPLAVVLVLMRCRDSGKGDRRVAAGLAGAALLGMGLAILVNRGVVTHYFSISLGSGDGPAGYIALLRMWWTNGAWPLLLFCVLAAALLARGAWLSWCLLAGRRPTTPELTELALAASTAAALLMPLLSGQTPIWRYLVPIAVLPLLWLAVLNPPRRLRRWLMPAAVALGLSPVLVVSRAEVQRTLQAFARPWTLEACLAAAGQRVGLASYWIAKREAYYEDRIRLVPIADGGVPFRFAVRDSWFDPHLGGPPSFIVTTYLDVAGLRRVFGPPARRLDCEQPVWLYDRPLRLWDAAAPAGNFESDAASLPSLTGRAEGGARIAEAGRDAAGFLSFGPYLSLPAGRYRAVLQYAAEGGGHRWDAVAEGGVRLLATGDLPPTGGTPRDLEILLDLVEPAAHLELRTYFTGQGRLELRSLAIQPD